MLELVQAAVENAGVMNESFSYLLTFLRKLESISATDDQVEPFKHIVNAVMPLFKKNQGLLQALFQLENILDNADFLNLLVQFFGTTPFAFHYHESESYTEYLKKHDDDEEKAMRAKKAELRKLFNSELTVISIGEGSTESECYVHLSCATDLDPSVMANCKDAHFDVPIQLHLAWDSHGSVQKNIKNVPRTLSSLMQHKGTKFEGSSAVSSGRKEGVFLRTPSTYIERK